MILLPAIDLLDGKVVRLERGERERVTVYSDDPVAVARQWLAAGAQWLHVVDLNGAFDGQYINLPLAERVMQRVKINVELSGGIRTHETLEKCLTLGAARVVLGTKACEDPAFVAEAVKRHGARIAVAIDSRGGEVVSRGWTQGSGKQVAAVVKELAGVGVQTFICTDVSRDGMLTGPNLEALRAVLRASQRQVIASGGVASLQDLLTLKTLEPEGVVGTIIGKALYEQKIDLAEAIRACQTATARC